MSNLPIPMSKPAKCILLTLVCALANSAHAQFVQQGGKLAGSGANGNAEQGHSVALSADGNTAIVGGPNANPIWFDPHTPPTGFVGTAWVFTRSGGVWTQQGSALLGSDAVVANGNGAHEGQSVALSLQDRGSLTSTVTVTIGGKNLLPEWAGIVSAGLYQINAQVPDVPAGDNAVVVTVGGVPTQSGANIYVGN